MNKSFLLKLTDVTKTFDGLDQPILDKVNFSISPGESIAITGVSGSGK
ncbi:MAG TPA: lipoprotein-releasing system ATP-binding protein LolD, partial [Methylophilaceae bacterium]|nr:lipoprotein-releasing system ATP-binding protein LolD [Methylophilaceae bacterium]